MKFFEIWRKNLRADEGNYEADIIHVDDNTFKTEVVQSELLVLAYFWAEWCPSCTRQSKVINEIAGRIIKNIKVVKINVDRSRKIVQLYSVSSIPAILLIRNGLELKREVGLTSHREIMKMMRGEGLDPLPSDTIRESS